MWAQFVPRHIISFVSMSPCCVISEICKEGRQSFGLKNQILVLKRSKIEIEYCNVVSPAG